MHATVLELEQLVTAQLPRERSAWLEHHCEACEACAAALANEARLEVSLRAMAADLRCGMRADEVVERPVPAAPRPRFFAFAGLAAATAVLLAFAAARLPQLVVHPEAPMVVADAGDLARAEPVVPAWATGGEPSGGTP